MVSWAALRGTLPAGWGSWSFPSAQYCCHTCSAVFGSGFPSTRDSVQKRATQMIKRLKHLTYLGKAETTWTILVLEKSRLRKCTSLVYINKWKETAEKMELGVSSGAQGQDWRQWAPNESQDAPSEHQETLFYCMGLKTGSGHSERLCSNF